MKSREISVIESEVCVWKSSLHQNNNSLRKHRSIKVMRLVDCLRFFLKKKEINYMNTLVKCLHFFLFWHEISIFRDVHRCKVTCRACQNTDCETASPETWNQWHGGGMG